MSTLRMIKAVLILSLISGSLFAQKKFVNPEGLLKPPGYTHVVIAGNTVYISGQVSADEKGVVIGKETSVRKRKKCSVTLRLVYTLPV